MAKQSLARTTISIGANIAGLQRGLKTAGASIKRFGRSTKQVGMAFSTAFSAPITAIGVTAVNVFKDFESEMSRVKAVSGATAQEFAALEKEAKRLGASTTFTATEVASLQTEFAKLGFTAKEITQVTESTLYLAQAAGTDLARAAEVAGSTLRGFGLEASETGHVTDVMAKSFSESALDMEAFAEAMKYVAPVAASAGISVEETTAMIELLANAGIKGSQAGTSLRRIISELGETGGDVAGAIKKLSGEGLNLADAKDEVGRSAQSALLVLSETIDTLPSLTEGLQNADGAAKNMADTMMDNTSGAFKELQSAVEGSKIEIGQAIAQNEVFKEGIRNITELMGKITKGIRGMTDEQQYNTVILGGLLAVVPLVITAIGSLTIAFGSLTAAMGPVGIMLAAITAAYVLLKKEVSEADKILKKSEEFDNTSDKLKYLQDELNKTTERYKMYNKYASQDPMSNWDAKAIEMYKQQKALEEQIKLLKQQKKAEDESWEAGRAAAQAAYEAELLATNQTTEANKQVKEQSKELDTLNFKWASLGKTFKSINNALPLKPIQKELKQAIDLTNGLAYQFSQNLSNAIAGAIVNGDSFFQSFITGLKAMAAQLVATIALVATLAALLVIATGGVSSLSLESMGYAMKTVSKGTGIGIPFLADGGIVTSPTLAMIGEGGESEAVIPLSRLNGMVSSGQQVEVYGRISGADILLSSEKAQRNRTRQRGF